MIILFHGAEVEVYTATVLVTVDDVALLSELLLEGDDVLMLDWIFARACGGLMFGAMGQHHGLLVDHVDLAVALLLNVARLAMRLDCHVIVLQLLLMGYQIALTGHQANWE